MIIIEVITVLAIIIILAVAPDDGAVNSGSNTTKLLKSKAI